MIHLRQSPRSTRQEPKASIKRQKEAIKGARESAKKGAYKPWPPELGIRLIAFARLSPGVIPAKGTEGAFRFAETLVTL
jgi:hypothetical protein